MFALLLTLLASAEPFPLTLKVGKTVAVCDTGAVQCPAGNPICDDTSIATAEVTEKGLVFKGVAPGTTLCSAASASGMGARQVFRVHVVE